MTQTTQYNVHICDRTTLTIWPLLVCMPRRNFIRSSSIRICGMFLITCEWQLYPQGSQRATLIGLSAATRFWIVKTEKSFVPRHIIKVLRRIFLFGVIGNVKSRSILLIMGLNVISCSFYIIWKKLSGENFFLSAGVYEEWYILRSVACSTTG